MSEPTKTAVTTFMWSLPDDEMLPLTRCVCGAEYKTWEVTISIYPEDPTEMPCCGRKLYFVPKIEVREVK